jgi:hypothetical protein
LVVELVDTQVVRLFQGNRPADASQSPTPDPVLSSQGADSADYAVHPARASENSSTLFATLDSLAFFYFACTLIHEQTSWFVCARYTKLYQKVCFFSTPPLSEIRG